VENHSFELILGLTAATCWGVSDFVARFASRRVGAYRALLVMQLTGSVVLTVFLISTGRLSAGAGSDWHPWALAVLAGILNTIGSLALYYSFEVGVLTVVAPISSSYPAITVALAFLSGERIHARNAVGLVITIIGVMLTATAFGSAATDAPSAHAPTPQLHLSRGVGWSLTSMISFGIMFWFLGFHVLPVLPAVSSVWVIRLSTSSMLLLAARPSHQSVAVPRGRVWWLLVIMGLMDTTAYVANNVGLRAGPVSLITVIASLYGAVTVLLSSIFLRERLAHSQWLGVAFIFAGILLVSF
jgi:drug/metabolite transporter (DMT)-like permease